MARGLFVHTSGRLDCLFDQLAQMLADQPLPPLEDEVVVVPSQGLARWLRLQLAERLGIAASVRLPFLGAFLGQVAGKHVAHADDALAKDLLLFRCWRVLSEPGSKSAFPRASDYCRDDADGTKMLQLCQRLAKVLDDYQVYRPELLAKWTAGDDTKGLHAQAPWQARLWRRLLADSGFVEAAAAPRKARPSPAGPLLFPEPAPAPVPASPIRLDRVRALLTDPATAARILPPRLTVFGASTLPPAFLQLLQECTRHVPVHVFVPQPAPLRDGDLSNPWIDSYGQQAREFANLLADHDGRDGITIDQVEVDTPVPAAPRTLLAFVQQEIGRLEGPTPPPFVVAADDASLRVHDCHSIQRELEVVRDQILAAFAADAALQPHEVLVLVPDVERYAPIAHAVFGPVADHLPFHVADRAPAAELPICSALFAMLQLAQSRVEVHDVFRILEEPAVHRQFQLFAGDLPNLRERCEQAGIRWGIDADSRARTCRVPAFDANSWRQGIERLLFGVATGPVDDLVLGVLPAADATSSRDEPLARFLMFVQQLFARLEPLGRPQNLDAWATLLDGLLAAMFAPETPDDDVALDKLRGAIARLRQAAAATGLRDPWSPVVLHDWLAHALRDGSSPRGFLAGAVTVAALTPMRTVPARRLFVCGLDDASFPRRSHALPFDLIAQDRQPGDRDARLDDRQLFLDVLLAAREQLHLTFVGHSQKDDSECAPSVLLAELLDHVDRCCTTGVSGVKARARLVVRHALQPWSTRYRSGDDPRLFTYHRANWTPPAAPCDEPPWFCEAVSVPPELAGDELTLDHLLEFWKHPCRFFLKHVCRMQVRGEDDAEATTEPFAVDSLDRWRIQDQIVRRAENDAAPTERLAYARATGLLPAFGHGELVFTKLDDEAQRFLRDRGTYGATSTRLLRVRGSDFTLAGTVSGVTPTHLVVARMATLKPKDRLRGFALHAAISVARGMGDGTWPERTVVLGKGAELVVFRPLAADDAHAALALLVRGYRHGLHAPLPFFPATSSCYADNLRGKDEAWALQKARDEWLPDTWSDIPSESEDLANMLCMRGRAALTDEFEQWAKDVFHALGRCEEPA